MIIINCNKCAIFNAIFDIKNIKKLLINCGSYLKIYPLRQKLLKELKDEV